MRVLIAEDETIVRMDIRSLLESEGLEVCGEARDGEEAVSLARSLEPDLAILDVKMPRLDGIQAARRITAERPIPLVMLSAFSQRSLVSRAIEAGASAYLVKPFGERDLMPAILTAAARHRAAPGRVPKRRPGAPRKREQEIVAAATRVFAEKGYAAASIQDVAEVVGILKGSLYYYFDTKEELLWKILVGVYDDALESLDESLASPGSALDRIRAFATSHVDFCARNSSGMSVFLREHDALGEERRRDLDERRAAYHRQLANLISEGQREGSVRAGVDPMLATRALLGMASGAARDFPAGTQLPIEEVAEGYADLIVAGLAA
jgi:DNA-binding NarL/FixJ family response regulator